MKITTQLALQYLKKNKKRSTTIIIGIALATILFISVFIILSSYQEYAMNIIRAKRNYEAEFKNITYEKAKEIVKDKNVEETSIIYNLGRCEENINAQEYMEEFPNAFPTKIELRSYNEAAIKNNNVNIVEGRFPINEAEIAVYVSDAENRIDLHIGEEIELTINGEKRKYTIVGKINYISTDVWETLATHTIIEVAITYFNENKIADNATVDASIITKNINEVQNTAENLVTKLNLYKDVEEKENNLSYNQELLNYALVNIQSNKETSIFGTSNYYQNSVKFEDNIIKILAITIALISVTAIIVIYTSFKMSYSEIVKELGILTSVGMNKEQRKKMLLKEGLILGALGIFVGIILGIILSFGMITILDVLTKRVGTSDYGIIINSNIDFKMIIPFKIIIITIILAYIITIISSILPMRSINKITPIEAIKRISNNKIKSNQVRTPRLVKKLFKQEGELAYKNIRRDKAKYKTIVISIVISIVLFISVNYILEYRLSKINLEDNFDYMIMGYDEESEVLFEKIKEKNLVEDYIIIGNIIQGDKGNYQVILPEDKLSDEVKDYIQNEETALKIDNNILSIRGGIFTLEGKAYDKLLENVNVEKLGVDECIVLDVQSGSTKYGNNIKMTNLKKGDTLTVKEKDIDKSMYTLSEEEQKILEQTQNLMGQVNQNSNTETINGTANETRTEAKKQKELKVVGALDRIDIDIPIQATLEYPCRIIVSEETIKELGCDILKTLYIKTESPYEIDTIIANYKKENSKSSFASMNEYDFNSTYNYSVLIKEIVIYGFIILIAFLSIANIFNTITSSITLRKREFAELKSLGMSNKQINKMLLLEGIFYGLDAIVYGILISIAVLYLIYKFIIDIYSNIGLFILPIKSFVLCILVTYIVIFIAILRNKKHMQIEKF